MGEVQGQGYIGQTLGIADVLAVTYLHSLNYRSGVILLFRQITLPNTFRKAGLLPMLHER